MSSVSSEAGISFVLEPSALQAVIDLLQQQNDPHLAGVCRSLQDQAWQQRPQPESSPIPVAIDLPPTISVETDKRRSQRGKRPRLDDSEADQAPSQSPPAKKATPKGTRKASTRKSTKESTTSNYPARRAPIQQILPIETAETLLTLITGEAVINSVLAEGGKFLDMMRAVHEHQVVNASDDPVAPMLRRCARFEKIERDVQFAEMITFIDLARYILQIGRDGTTRKHVFKKHEALIGKSYPTFEKWINKGRKYCPLAASGTIYTLLLLALCPDAISIVDKLGVEIVHQLCAILRHPDPASPAGKIVIQYLIPLVDQLRRRYPLKFIDVFANYHILGHLECHDIGQSDAFFNKYVVDTFAQQRDLRYWAACGVPVPVDSSMMHSSTPLSAINGMALSGMVTP